MIEDYKKNLINYMTGNLTEGTPTVDEIIKEQIEINRSKWVDYIPSRWKNFHYEGIIKEKNSGNLILYGGYRTPESTEINDEVYGIITLLDYEFNPIKTFYEYEDGTKLRYVQIIKQAEDNTFFMVDDTIFAHQSNDTILTSQKRFILLNNFTSFYEGDYKLIMRKSYIFPTEYNTFKCENIEKNQSSSQYVMVGKVYEDHANNYQSIASIELNIPYGDSPTWDRIYVVKSISTLQEFSGSNMGCSYIEFDEDKYLVKIICRYLHRNRQTSELYSPLRYYYKNTNSNTYSYIDLMQNSTGLSQTEYLEHQGMFINNNVCYFVLSNLEQTTSQSQELYIILYEYNTLTNVLTKMYEKSYGNAVANHNEQMYLYSNQGELYIESVINKGNNLADYYIQRYTGEWNPILVGENKPYAWNQRDLFVINNYNLIEIFLYPNNPRNATWYFKILKEVYNSTQYNGEPYVSKDSLCPLFSNLYSNGSLVFSRNLYNITKQNNMTMSSVEIPSTYLNDLTINQNDLISETNLEMNNDLTSWNKNIYEVVDLNFLNTITIIDEDNNVEYLNGATKLNQATTDGGATNYTNAPCTKYRINYLDNTTDVQELSWSSIDDTHKECEISIFVDKPMLSIDLISHDETSVYLNIPLNVEIGKYYTINQKVRIGG